MDQNLSVNSPTPSVTRSTQPTSSSKPDIEFDTNTCHQVLPISASKRLSENMCIL